jgi:hypothetical protein
MRIESKMGPGSDELVLRMEWQDPSGRGGWIKVWEARA